MKSLPEKTIERLSVYRRTLLNCLDNGKEFIYSHELAELHNITAVQVRRDLMLIGYSTTLKKGYDVKALVDLIREIVAAFDTDPEKVNRVISGVKVYPMNQLQEIIDQKDISIGILTVPPEHASKVAESLVVAGAKGILNYTSVPVNVSSDIILENYDMTTSLEKVAYYVKQHTAKTI